MINALYIDIGTRFTKIKCNNQITTLENKKLNFSLFDDKSQLFISSVSEEISKKIPDRAHVFSSKKKYKSLINGYDNPSQLGVDRWMGLIACYEKTKDSGFILIDVGTAITLDIVNRNHQHMGGLIMPGINFLCETFPNFIFNSTNVCCELGKNTTDAWSNGVLGMMVHSINYYLSIFIKDEDYQILLTGGNAELLSRHIVHPFKIYENLVLDGIEYSSKYMR